MRALLALPALLLACDEAPSGDFEAYDPDEVVEESPAQMEPIASSGRKTAWVHPQGRVLAGFTAPQMGRWTWPGAEPGYDAGDAACRDLGGHHACSAEEIEEAVELGDFLQVPPEITFWSNERRAPLHERCSATDEADPDGRARTGYTYEGADRSWSGRGRTSSSAGDRMAQVIWSHPPEVEWDGACRSDPERCAAIRPSGFPCNEELAIACCHE
jgi:hypothetical protein